MLRVNALPCKHYFPLVRPRTRGACALKCRPSWQRCGFAENLVFPLQRRCNSSALPRETMRRPPSERLEQQVHYIFKTHMQNLTERSMRTKLTIPCTVSIMACQLQPACYSSRSGALAPASRVHLVHFLFFRGPQLPAIMSCIVLVPFLLPTPHIDHIEIHKATTYLVALQSFFWLVWHSIKRQTRPCQQRPELRQITA